MCVFCDGGTPLAIGNTNDYGIAIKFSSCLIAYGYDVHGCGSNGLIVKISYCPMCGAKLSDSPLNPYGDYLLKLVENRGMSLSEASEQPMVKARLEYFNKTGK